MKLTQTKTYENPRTLADLRQIVQDTGQWPADARLFITSDTVQVSAEES